MDDARDDGHSPLSPAQLLDRVDNMVRAGRISEEDGDRLRAAATSGDLDEAIADVRRKHAGARVAQAVESGRISPEDGAVLLERIERGEDPAEVLRGVRTAPARRSPDVADE
jgi:hypothetical protein